MLTDPRAFIIRFLIFIVVNHKEKSIQYNENPELFIGYKISDDILFQMTIIKQIATVRI